MWCLNDPEEYLVKFDLYNGKHSNANLNYEEISKKFIDPHN